MLFYYLKHHKNKQESLRCKEQALISASEAAEMILRVDSIIRCAPRRRERMWKTKRIKNNNNKKKKNLKNIFCNLFKNIFLFLSELI